MTTPDAPVVILNARAILPGTVERHYHHREDLTGQTFGRLRVLRRWGSYSGGPAWLCLCACGALSARLGSQLRSGLQWSCAGGLCLLGPRKARERPPGVGRARGELARVQAGSHQAQGTWPTPPRRGPGVPLRAMVAPELAAEVRRRADEARVPLSRWVEGVLQAELARGAR